jgi:5-methyltetrahydrofolate--homocysteine methyltransferase
MEILSEIADKLEAGEDEKVRALTEGALAQSIEAPTILNEGLIAGMQTIGERFGAHEIFLPDVLLAAKAMNAGLAVLEPHLGQGDVSTRGKVVIGTVQGDLHDIGKNLVGIMLAGAGFEVIDLGKDVSPQQFVDKARESGANVIGMSALLTTTMPVMKQVVSLLKEQGLDSSVRTVIGGAPVTEEYAREIGADAYGFDAANAVERVRALVE